MAGGQLINVPYLEDETKDSLAARVFVPNQYSPLYKYGILYVFDGLDYLSNGRLQTLIEREFGDRLPFLIALLPITAALREAAYHPEGIRHERHLHAIARGLVRTLESEYTLIPLGSARGLLGSSLGASMAFSLATTYPKRFRYLATESPYLPEAQGKKWHELTKATMVGCEADIFIGDEEHNGTLKNGQVHDYIRDARKYESGLIESGCHVKFHLRKGDHTWGAWQEDLPVILHTFASQVRLQEGDSTHTHT